MRYCFFFSLKNLNAELKCACLISAHGIPSTTLYLCSRREAINTGNKPGILTKRDARCSKETLVLNRMLGTN